MSDRNGRGQSLSPVGAYPAEVLDRRPELLVADWFGVWLTRAAVMGA